MMALSLILIQDTKVVHNFLNLCSGRTKRLFYICGKGCKAEDRGTMYE